MERSGAASRYARAIFNIAVEESAADRGAIDRWRGEVEDVASVLTDSDLARLLGDSRVARTERQRVIERVLDISPRALNYARLLVEKNRTLEARHIAEEFARLADEHQGIANARITTAVDLSPERVEAITEQLSRATGKSIRTATSVDPALIGGIIVRIDDRLFDGSVRTRLTQLRRHLSGAV